MKEEEPFICKQCGKRFDNLKAVTGHKRIHSLKYKKIIDGGVKEDFSTSFDDLEQQQEAAANAALTLMMLRGDTRELGKNKSRDKSKRKTFKCVVCFKEFGSGTALGGHMRAHYKKCLVCSKVLNSGEDLEDHKRAGCCVRKRSSNFYKCLICFREFGSRRALGDHKRVHNNVATKQQGSYTLDLLHENQAGGSFSGSYESPSDMGRGAQEITLQCENKF